MVDEGNSFLANEEAFQDGIDKVLMNHQRTLSPVPVENLTDPLPTWSNISQARGPQNNDNFVTNR